MHTAAKRNEQEAVKILFARGIGKRTIKGFTPVEALLETLLNVDADTCDKEDQLLV